MAEIIRNVIAFMGAWIIYGLICLFGRRISLEDTPWLKGPIGGELIGDLPYSQCAKEENLTIERNATDGGLIEDFNQLAGPDSDIGNVHPEIKHFYEHSAEYKMNVWSKTWFPMNIGLWLLVTTISRKVDQLNFPMDALASAKGMTSEIILLKRQDGSLKYTGWLRTMENRVLYTGFYMLEKIPGHRSPCVKVVFPMPRGNATVMLRPEVDSKGDLFLVSEGKQLGDPGFYRIQRFRSGWKVWRIRSLKERFHLYKDPEGILRCDHNVRFWGLPVLTLHYQILPLTGPTV